LGTMDDALSAARHLNSGAFAPLIAEVLPLAGVAEGHRRLEQGNAAGKLVVRVGR
jgi:NADPH:quinone reductase-like Zn-dependent oxidoreductase